MSIHLVLGGARSGKSSHAEALARASSDPLHYIATAEAHDEEMAERIRHHRQSRSERFQVHECPRALADTLLQLDTPGHTILVDCLTLWLGNRLSDGEESWRQTRHTLLTTLEQLRAQVLLVSNEVGWGVVPMGAETRRFVDEAGRLHQAIAERADRVTLVVAGLPHRLK